MKYRTRAFWRDFTQAKAVAVVARLFAPSSPWNASSPFSACTVCCCAGLGGAGESHCGTFNGGDGLPPAMGQLAGQLVGGIFSPGQPDLGHSDPVEDVLCLEEPRDMVPVLVGDHQGVEPAAGG